MEDMYVTVVGFQHYYDKIPFGIGNLVRCSKEPENLYDKEAIRCTLPAIGKVGYIANSVNTVAGGTMSAGRVYDKVKNRFYVRVMFTTNSKIICKVEHGDLKELEKELQKQLDDEWLDNEDE